MRHEFFYFSCLGSTFFWLPQHENCLNDSFAILRKGVYTLFFFFKNIELNLKSKSKFSFLKIILANVFFYKK